MVNKALIPPGLSYITDNIINKGNLLGAAKGAGASWAKEFALPKNMETMFFAGCGYQYSDELESLSSLIRKMDKSIIGSEFTMGIASFQKKLGIDAAGIYRKVMTREHEAGAQPLKDAVKVLQKLGLQFGYLAEDEPCCGSALHYVGLEKEFKKHSTGVFEQFKAAGVKQIIGIVPSCTNTLRNLIPQSTGAQGPEVKHFCQVVAEHINSLNLRFPREVKVTYHDPCQLVRYLKLVDEPRTILNAIKGVKLVEPEWTSREWATCCGGGAGFEAVFPELSEILAVNRVKELTATGAEIIVTHCPGCIMQLKAGLKELKISNVEVLDLAQIVAMSLRDK